jgi:hypothetical protein
MKRELRGAREPDGLLSPDGSRAAEHDCGADAGTATMWLIRNRRPGGMMGQRSRRKHSEHDETTPVPEPAEVVSERDHHDPDDTTITSPVDFYEAVRNRPDIREILSRLARS